MLHLNAEFQQIAETWDYLARNYDKSFGLGPYSHYMRKRNLQYLTEYFKPGMHLLELGCGTGAEAIALAKLGLKITALDISPRMIAVAQKKALKVGISSEINFCAMPIEKINNLTYKEFDGVYSSFGPLNCVKNLASLVKQVAHHLTSSGLFLATVMNRFCLAEMFMFCLFGKFSQVFRRLHKNPNSIYLTNANRTLYCYYYTPHEFIAYLNPYFLPLQYIAIPFLLPPPSFENSGFASITRKMLGHIDSKLAKRFPFNLFGDHFLIIARKK